MNVSDLEKYNPEKHKDAKIAPSTQKEMGGEKKEGKSKAASRVLQLMDSVEDGGGRYGNMLIR